jgi:hypothetical protein
MRSLVGAELVFPVVLLTDIPEFRPDEASLSRSYARGGCKTGDRLPKKEGLRVIDQSGRLCTIERAVIREVHGPAVKTSLNLALTWIGFGVRMVTAEITVDCLKTIDIGEAKTLILPLAENASEVVDPERIAYNRAKKARTIPELIIAIRSLTV